LNNFFSFFFLLIYFGLYPNEITKIFFYIDVHHGNYNPSCKAKSNMQEDSNGPMTRARVKQLQRALTSQIGMIEVASELKISNQFEIGSRMFICVQLELGDWKSP
jgi:hypothetical protein